MNIEQLNDEITGVKNELGAISVTADALHSDLGRLIETVRASGRPDADSVASRLESNQQALDTVNCLGDDIETLELS